MKILSAIHQADVWLFTRLMKISNKAFWTRSARIVSVTGDAYFAIAISVWLYIDEQFGWLTAMALAFSIERLVYFGAKHGFKRSRPEQAIEGFSPHIKPADRYSFPSGHSSAAFLLVILIVIMLGSNLAWLYIWAVLVALSRMMLGLHFPSDLITGAATGVVSVLIAHYWVLS